MLETQDVVSASPGAKTPNKSWSMKRPARVPASTAVRMNRASNRMAKWYQKAIMALPPMTDEKICAMPTASVGAPPAREMMVCSPTSCAVWSICSGVTGTFGDFRGGAGRGGADHRAGRVHREIDTWLDDAGRDQRHDGDKGLHQHAA